MAKKIYSKEETAKLYDLAINHGCVKSFNTFVTQFTPVLRKLLRDEDYHPNIIEDAVQNTFLQILKSGKLYDPTKSNVLTWMLTISRRRAFDLLKHERHHKVGIKKYLKLSSKLSSKLSYTESQMEHDEKLETVRTHLYSLSNKDLDNLNLYYNCEIDSRKLSVSTGVPATTIRQYTAKVRNKLRDKLEPYLKD